MSEIELKNCPCGKPVYTEDTSHINKPKIGVYCTNNFCPINWDYCYSTEAKAAKHWNDFWEASALQTKVDELELKLELRQVAYDMDNRLGKENEELQSKLDKAVEALEEVDKQLDFGNVKYAAFAAQQALVEIKETK